MRIIGFNRQILFLTAIFFAFGGLTFSQAKKNFTIVIDAGHGGKDTGARGVVDLEKNIALDVAMKFGQQIEKNHKDVNVIYTRTGDYFLELWERAAISNRNHANLFVSIHCNSAAREGAAGSETFVMSIRRMDENIEVSRRENSVILLEEDQERYQTFDPNDEEAVIAFEVMHSAYLDQSIKFATLVEDEFVKGGRNSRGVKRGNLHVLRQNASPSVLVEIGFISNYDEGVYLSTEKGKNERANAIYRAFERYKQEFDLKNGIADVEEPEEKPEEPKVEEPVYGQTFKVMFLTSKNKLPPSTPMFKGLTGVEVIQDGEFFKYYYGNTSLPSERDELLEYIKRKGFKEAFPVTFFHNKKLEGRENYRIQILVSPQKYRERDAKFRGLKNIERRKVKKNYFYYYGYAKTYQDAQKELNLAKSKGFDNAYIVVFNRNNPKK